MIRAAIKQDMPKILMVINDAAQRYRHAIPADLYHEPYMSEAKLAEEISAGVSFAVLELGGAVVAVMGIQHTAEVSIVRHSYVLTEHQGKGFGSALLRKYLDEVGTKPMLVGCLAAMTWAIEFYQRHGFQIVSPGEILPLRQRYWTLPDGHIRRSVVLGNTAWFKSAVSVAVVETAQQTGSAHARVEQAIQYADLLYAQITDHKEVRDRWFRYYLLVIGIPFGVLGAGLQASAWDRMVGRPNELLLLLSLLLLLVGFLFFMLYIRQRLNYLSVYQRAWQVERMVIMPAILATNPQQKMPEVGQFSADFYANGVHILLNSVWGVLVWIFGARVLIERGYGAWLWLGGVSALLLSVATHVYIRDRVLDRAHRALQAELYGIDQSR